MAQSMSPVHPGEILFKEFMEPLGVTQYRLAKETAVSPRRINEIVQGLRAVTADTALRLAKFFGTSEMFWLNLQARYDLDVRRQDVALRSTLARTRTFTALRMALETKNAARKARAPEVASQRANRPALHRKVK